MAKKSTDIRRVIISNIKKNKIFYPEMSAFFKYELDKNQRKYILEKLPESVADKIYGSPLPKTYDEICQNESLEAEPINLINELSWYFEILLTYGKQLNVFLILNNKLENAILKSDFENALEILNEIDEKSCTSFYALISEFYINENYNDPDENKNIITEMYANGAKDKVTILSEYNRVRVDKKITSWQYNSFVDEHKKLYSKQKYIDYIIYKLDPLRYETQISDLPFITFFDSDLSIIDRYFSLKKLLVLAVSESQVSQELEKILLDYSDKMFEVFGDYYWKQFNLINGFEYSDISERANNYYEIQDLYFNAKYDELINKCSRILDDRSNCSEIYLFFIQSIIFLNKSLGDYVNPKTELFEILNLMEEVLKKTVFYSTDREKLLKKYFAICHFEYSNVLLEFILNEYHLSNPEIVSLTSFISSVPIRYNFYKQIKDKSLQNKILNSIGGFKTFEFIKNQINGMEIDNYPNSFFKNKVEIGYLMSIENYQLAIEKLNTFNKYSINTESPEFVTTWFNKNAIKCQIKLGNYDKAADIIVDYFFKKDVAYNHFFDKDLFENLAESENELFYSDISIPILFQIYNQSINSIYDSIANFLVANDVYKPSELIAHGDKWEFRKFIFLLEKCFTKENIEDSPFLNSIDILEQERITILNFLRDVNPSSDEEYNEEILKITKESSIRKGLLQIHESRIYVDVNNLLKKLKVEYKDVFERYLDFQDTTYGEIYSLTLTSENVPTDLTYYFKEPIDNAIFQIYDYINDYTLDDNVVYVPFIRYKLYLSLFEDIKDNFVFDEDFGFKSFLSMRIRHGTFSNVLRSVFDKFHLISSKDSGVEYIDIEYWNEKISDKSKTADFQIILKKFSEDIDIYIDKALSWVKVYSEENGLYSGTFDFEFRDKDLFDLYRNRLGRITLFHDFIEEIFDILFERLEECLAHLRSRISLRMTPHFLNALSALTKDMESIGFDSNDKSLIEQEILRCTTEIQVTTSHVTNWFKISKNQYIEEFPFDLILQTIINYMNSINHDVLTKASVNIDNSCVEKFKGKYFESFGDILINLLDNIISKNKDLGESLSINIKISSEDDQLRIEFTNNLSENTDIEKLQENVQATIAKIENYKNGSEISFEQGSGFLKLCKLIAVDLNREKYTILPKCSDNTFEVYISFDLKDLVS